MIFEYELGFTPTALKQWEKLDNSIKQAFKKVLVKRLTNPKVPSAQLNLKNSPIVCYKIKLKNVGYRLIYTVLDDQLIVAVITINRRDVVYADLATLVNKFDHREFLK